MTDGVAEEYVAKYGVVSGRFEEKVSISSVNASASPQTPFQHSKNTLERLPLPTFDGSKLNYLRFKKEFSNHVTYTSDKERMLALKTKCLLRSSDKNRVMNEQTLKDCFERLDEEYGDIHTLVGDIFLTWSNLKPPKTDQEFIKFVSAIENGASCLRSLGHEKELDFSYMSVTLENKMDERMKKEFSLEWCRDQSTDKERMKSLLKYLLEQKRAAHMRACNYKVQSARTKDDDFFDDAVKANSTLHGGGGRDGRGRDSRGRGGGRGRGRGESGSSDYRSDNKSFRGRGGNRGQGTYGGKRGESSKTCLVCDKDHQTSK